MTSPTYAMRTTLVLAVALASASTASAWADAGSAAAPSASPKGMVRVSDERTDSRWAYPATRAFVYSRPTGKARRVAKLHWLTEDRLPEVYLVLSEWVDERRDTWAKIRVPKRPNGTTGWVRRENLRQYERVTTMLEIDKRKRRATLYRAGRKIWQAGVGIGAPGTETPSGRFYVREKFHVRGTPVYGPRAIGTSAYAPTLSDWPGGGVVGIHGTNAPGLIPGKVSHGCIRVRNAAIMRLYRLITRGTPIWIH